MKKTKTVEILIVIVVLLLVAALIGCKDEAEAREPNTLCSEPCDAIHCRWKDGVMGGELEIYDPHEPNKPEYANEPVPGTFFAIPTWPDYIELPKTLVIGRGTSMTTDGNTFKIAKGTKIYFKDE